MDEQRQLSSVVIASPLAIINQRGSGGALDAYANIQTPVCGPVCVLPPVYVKADKNRARGYVLHVPGRRYLRQRPDFCRNLDSSHEEAAALEAAILTPEHISLVMCSCSERFVFPEHLFSFPEYQISRLHF